MLAALQEAERRGVSVLLTTDHGSIHCETPATVYAKRDATANLRYKFGEDLRAEHPEAAITVEDLKAFGLPGMGKLLVGGLAGGDLPVIMGVVLVVSFAVAIANLIVDVVYTWIDPRVRAVGADEGSGTVAAPRLRLPAQPQVKESTT